MKLLEFTIWPTALFLAFIFASGKDNSPHRFEQPREKKIADLKSRITSNPKEIPTLLQLATLLTDHTYNKPNAQNIIEALKLYDKVLEIDPDNPKALLSIARISMDVEVFSKAKEFYSRYIEIARDDKMAKLDLALVKYKMGEILEAKNSLEDLTTTHPSLFGAHLGLFLIYNQEGDKNDLYNL